MKNRLSHIAILGLLAAVLSQCVSPLDPDTPRTIVPNPDENATLPPKSDTLRVSYLMDGIVRRGWDTRPEIQNWPTYSMVPDSFGSTINTLQQPYAFKLSAMYREPGLIDSMNIDINNIRIVALDVHLDSLVLPMDSSTISLDKNQFNQGNSISFEVAYQARAGANLNDVDTLSTGGDTSETNAVILECTMHYAGYDHVEDTFTLNLNTRFRIKSTRSEYLYEAVIALKQDP